MILDLYVTIRGVVSGDVVRLLVNGVDHPLTGNNFAVEVPVTTDFVAVTTIEKNGRERTATMRLTTAAIPVV